MSDGPRSGRSTGRVSCKSTELKRCSIIEMRWNRLSMIMIIIIFCVGHKDDECYSATAAPIIIIEAIGLHSTKRSDL